MMPEHVEAAPGPWQRVSPRYVVVVMARAILVGLVLAVIAACIALFWHAAVVWWLLIPIAVFAAILLVIARRRAAAIGFRLRDDDLLFRRGILFQRFVAVPYGRMQLIDIERDPLDRVLGLSELKFVTAAASTDIVVPGLPEPQARELRDRLVALAESRRAGL